MTDRATVYQDEAGEWRWRRRSENGDIVAVSGEGYASRDGAETAASRENPDAELEYEEDEGS